MCRNALVLSNMRPLGGVSVAKRVSVFRAVIFFTVFGGAVAVCKG